MINHDPEGYRKLLAYQKACDLQIAINQFILNLPKTKTFFDLADQMGRSGRSGSKNIVEGWKRNTTKEYFTFLGFSIGAVEELKDDAADIVTGVYPALMGLRGSMGEMGLRGEKGSPFTPSTHSTPSSPLVPFAPLSRAELDQIKFYPLDLTLPAAIQIFLRAKEVNFLLNQLQKSLDIKMDRDKTKPLNQRLQEKFAAEKKADEEFQKYLKNLGLRRLENGRMVGPEDPDYPGV